jgi:hypothetical protein
MEGGIIHESLDDLSLLDSLTILKEETIEAGDRTADQPAVWTLATFSAPDEQASEIADELAEVIKEGPWYVDFSTAEEKFVVFSGRIFRYPRGDESGRELAADFARSAGVPPSQIDWPE